jgi:hypothetical protein
MPHYDDGQEDLFMPIAESPPKIKLTPIQRRLMEAAVREEAQKILFQHTVLAQTSLPYRDPGEGVREWRREQGAVSLKIDAGEARHPDTGEWVKLGLPWGTKPRLILAHLNREALLHESPEIAVGDSLTEFVKRIRGFKHGREIRAFKDQLGRLSAALVRLAMIRDGRGFQVDTKVVSGFELWFPKDERQRVLWPSYVRLSLDYYESLRKHAIPLDEGALAALAHSAMALDVYAWLAQRLCRIRPKHKQFVTWAALKDQFGFGYGRIIDFKRSFRQTLVEVHTQYRGAKFDVDNHGMTLFYSLPPVQGRHLELIKDD